MIVLLGKFFGWNNKLDGNKLEALPLESGHNLRNQASLDTIRLDGDEGALHLCSLSLLVLEHVNCSGDGSGDGSPSRRRSGVVGSVLVVGVGGGEGLPAQDGERGGAALGGGGALGGGEEEGPGGLEQLLGGGHGGGGGLGEGRKESLGRQGDGE